MIRADFIVKTGCTVHHVVLDTAVVSALTTENCKIVDNPNGTLSGIDGRGFLKEGIEEEL